MKRASVSGSTRLEPIGLDLILLYLNLQNKIMIVGKIKSNGNSFCPRVMNFNCFKLKRKHLNTPISKLLVALSYNQIIFVLNPSTESVVVHKPRIQDHLLHLLPFTDTKQTILWRALHQAFPPSLCAYPGPHVPTGEVQRERDELQLH